ncbi:MAG: LUD domain-containing protein [Melioribacter sp.]|uniref:LUD domain-containing protein n=1 Tax=Rosettibacter primus TaxID=3111523 RepID=UPI00247DEF1E|nr:LUD domain-containing protein [Melioribacter sp.]
MNQVTKQALVEKFITKAQNACAKVQLIQKNSDSLTSLLENLIADEKQILFIPPKNIEPNLFEKFLSNDKVITNPDKEQLKNIKTSITGASYGIASTGSVAISITNDLTIYLSMLVKKHIVILDAKYIVDKPRDLFNESMTPGNSFTIITGPSATADMGPLVRGVHGPGELFIIVLGD